VPERLSPDVTPARTAAPITLVTVYFNKLELTGDSVIMMDGGTHGVRGHTLTWDAHGRGRWERRVDSFDRSGGTGAGELALDAATLSRLGPRLEAAWQLALAEKGHVRRFPPPDRGPPRWVWAIAMRRGDDAVLLEGGDFPGRAPREAKDLLGFLATEVDARLASTGDARR
jgi:hypothetical protein